MVRQAVADDAPESKRTLDEPTSDNIKAELSELIGCV